MDNTSGKPDYEDEFMIGEFKVPIKPEVIKQAKLYLKTCPEASEHRLIDSDGNTLAIFKRKPYKTKRLEEYTTTEMLDWFEKAYKEAMRQLEYLREHGYEQKDADHYTWEMVMELLGKDIWHEWNNLYR